MGVVVAAVAAVASLASVTAAEAEAARADGFAINLAVGLIGLLVHDDGDVTAAVKLASLNMAHFELKAVLAGMLGGALEGAGAGVAAIGRHCSYLGVLEVGVKLAGGVVLKLLVGLRNDEVEKLRREGAARAGAA